MILKDNGDIETKDESNDESMSLEDDDDSMENPVTRELLIARHALNVQVKDEDQVQHDNIFNTRCHIKEKICSVIIHGGSCTNVASTNLVEQFSVPTSKHPRPYKLKWLNDCRKVKVTKQVLVPFIIGRYKDEVLCDVVPIYVGHLLLEHPWQYERRVMHDGYKNR